MSTTHRARLGLRRAALLTLALCGWLWAGAAVQAQNRVFFINVDKAGAVTDLEGTILDESKKEVSVRPLKGNKVVIAAENVIDIFYAVGKPDLQAEYKKAWDADQTAAKTAGAQERKRLLEEAIKKYQELYPKLDKEKTAQRHVQFRIANLSAHAAGADRTKLFASIDLLEKFLKEHPDSWQSFRGEQQLKLMKGGK